MVTLKIGNKNFNCSDPVAAVFFEFYPENGACECVGKTGSNAITTLIQLHHYVETKGGHIVALNFVRHLINASTGHLSDVWELG